MHKHYLTTGDGIRNILRTFYSKPRLVSAVKKYELYICKVINARNERR